MFSMSLPSIWQWAQKLQHSLLFYQTKSSFIHKRDQETLQNGFLLKRKEISLAAMTPTHSTLLPSSRPTVLPKWNRPPAPPPAMNFILTFKQDHFQIDDVVASHMPIILFPHSFLFPFLWHLWGDFISSVFSSCFFKTKMMWKCSWARFGERIND